MKNVGIIVPTCRQDSIKLFLEKWDFPDYCKLFIIEDNPEKKFKLSKDVHFHGSWKDFEGMKNNWIFSKNCGGGIRSYGFWEAYQESCDYFITLDDDCLPTDDCNGEKFVEEHIKKLEENNGRWLWTTQQIRPRGVPYTNLGVENETLINMGFWKKNADFDAPTQLMHGSIEVPPNKLNPIPKGYYAPICFCPKERVLMSDGTTKEIEKVLVGDVVITDKAERHKVLRRMKRKISEDIYEVSFSGTNEKMKVTENHQLLTDSGWKKVSDLSTADFLAFPKGNKNFNIKILTDDEMYLLGVFLAEGCYRSRVRKKNGRIKCGVIFSLHAKEEKTIAKNIRRIMLKKYGKNGSIHIRKNQLTIEFNGKNVADWFYSHCGEYSFSKFIDEKILYSSNVEFLIKGMWEGDGHVGLNRGTAHISYTTISKKLADQVKTLLSLLGYSCLIHKHKPKNRVHSQYKIHLYSQMAIDFCHKVLGKEINPISKYQIRGRRFRQLVDYIGVRVTKIEKINYCGYVYNLTIEDNHTYIVNWVVAKNCGMNLSFKRKAVPLMFQPLMGEIYGVWRFDDIWCGIIAKKICDHLDYLIRAGSPDIVHSRASNVWTNLKKETAGLEANEEFWEMIDEIELKGKTINDCYLEIAKVLKKREEEYCKLLGVSMEFWVKLFKE